MTLYHGSNTNIIGNILTPHISFDYKPLVYATDDFAYAVVRCGKFNIEDISIKEDYRGFDHLYTLVELCPNAFKDIFDVSGTVYFVDDVNFSMVRDNEYISEKEVSITNKVHIDNVWGFMINGPFSDRYNLFPYEGRDYYFNVNNIDFDAYMARRQERIQKIKNIKGE